MFSKNNNNNNNNNTYLFPHDHHHHHPRSSVVDLNGVELFLHHHHHHHHPDIFSSGHHYNNNNNILSADNHHHHHASNLLLLNQADVAASSQKKAQPSKKDRHSKIFTSQGPRDRRVRLSIGIARKFFDLQEMLGFDKPSKTLDWLLTKSKAAIKDLIHSKDKANRNNNKMSISDQSDDNNDNDNDENDDLVIIPSHHQLLDESSVPSKGKSVIVKGAGAGAGASSLAKESRAKARARARERTREKMCIKQMNNKGENGPCLGDSPFNGGPVAIYNKSVINQQLGLFQDQDLIQESVSGKRKATTKINNAGPSFFGFQQNVFVSSRDSSSNYSGGVVGPFVANNNNNNNENWDVCSFTSQSNMCAILEQQKFMNSPSNM